MKLARQRQIGITTARALALIGTPREDGEVHTVYSAAKACGMHAQGLYKAYKREGEPHAAAARARAQSSPG